MWNNFSDEFLSKLLLFKGNEYEEDFKKLSHALHALLDI